MVCKITDIKPQMLHEMGLKGVILDIDNTLAAHGCRDPFEGVVEWLELISDNGFKRLIISNNTCARVEAFAELLNLEFVALARKPRKKGFKKAAQMLNIKPDEIAVIGDQIFTDILGANLSGMKSVLLDPAEREPIYIRLKRVFERPVRRRIK